MSRGIPRRIAVPALFWLATFLLAGLFALRTPRWQAPDEPAHYAYVAHVASHGRPPLLVAACYDEAYIVALRSSNFVQEPDLDRFCYEGHQPPLFYYLAAPIFLLGGGSLLLLRLFAAAVGALVVPLVWAIARTLGSPHWLALATAGMVALLPQHNAMIGSFNNDALAFPVVALALFQMVRLLVTTERAGRDWLLLGIFVGLALLTKATAWVVLPLALLTVLLARPRPRRKGAAAAVRVLGAAALFILPWFGRNALLYPGPDVMALSRHDQITIGQPRTEEELARRGLGGTLLNGTETTFNSFWGQFGWMKAPLRPAEYALLWSTSALALAGLLRWLARRGWRRDGLDGRALTLLAAWASGTALMVLVYNLEFVQYQGRYLFPALGAIALFYMIGLGGWFAPRLRPPIWALFLLFLLYLDFLALLERLPGMVAY